MKRTTFALGWSVLVLIAYLIESIFGSDPIFEALILALLLTWPAFLITGKRLHDIKESAWWSLLLTIPYLSVVVVLVLVFRRGSMAQNDFGLPQEITKRADVSPTQILNRRH